MKIAVVIAAAPAVIAATIVTGCVTVTSRSEPIAVPPVHVVTSVAPTNPRDDRLGRWMFNNVYGPETVFGELWLGCCSYYTQEQRWPRTRAEIETGLSLLGRKAVHLPTLAEIAFREEGPNLAITFSRPGEPARHLRITKPTPPDA